MMIHLLLAFLVSPVLLSEVLLNCQNGGKPSQTHCFCPPNFVGTTCELPATPLTATPAPSTLSDEYTYFYYQPNQVNFYKLNFTICMKDNPSQIATQFFISTQKVNGSLQALPAFFETYKLILAQNGCTNFTSHYISIKRREDDSYRRIIVGMRTMVVNSSKFYFNIYKSHNISREEYEKIATNQGHDSLPQSVTIQMDYELYLQTNYQGSFIIMVTSVVLMGLFAVVISYVKKKYTEEEEFTSFRFTEEDQYSYSRNRRRRQNPQMDDYEMRNDLTIVHVFMPATAYGTCCKYYNHNLLKSCIQPPQKYPQAQTCSICLVQFTPEDEIRTTPCKHIYHRQCIDSWCESNLSCPICRRPLDFTKQFRTIYLKYLRGQLQFAI